MVESEREIEGGFRMVRIRQTKLYLYIVQFVLLLAIVVVLIYLEGGFSLKPFYLPLSAFIYFVILMLLVFNIEGCFFRGLEIKFAKSDSARYYMVKKSIRRSLLIIIVAAIVIIILWVPFISDGIETALSDSGEVNGVKSFYNKDFLGLTTTQRISLSCDGDAQVYVVAEDNYLANVGNLDQLRFYRMNTDYVVDPTLSFSFPETDYGRFYFVVDYRYSTADTVDFTLQQHLSSTFRDLVPLLALFFIIVNVGWIAYLYQLKSKYSKKAIYR